MKKISTASWNVTGGNCHGESDPCAFQSGKGFLRSAANALFRAAFHAAEDQLSFQLGVFADVGYGTLNARVEVESPLEKWLSVTQVREMPSAHPVSDPSDGNYLRTTPGLYPDLLQPLSGGGFRLAGGRWNALWIQICSDQDTPAGEFPVRVTVSVDGEPPLVLSASVAVEVIPAVLPPQELIRTEWFHGDCLADYYHVEVFSEPHWNFSAGRSPVPPNTASICC